MSAIFSKRIAVVSPYDLDRPGGVQDQVVGLVNNLNERGFSARAIGPRSSDGSLGRVTPISANGAVAPIALSPWIRRRLMREIGSVDVVHIHEPFMPMVSWMALSVPATKVVTFHADPTRSVQALYRLVRPSWALKGVRSVTAVSEVAARAIRPWLADISVIPNGVTLLADDMQKVPNRVAFVGRDDPRKGLDVLLGAWPQVRQAQPDAELIVVGSERPPQEGVTFLGRVDEGTKTDVLRSAAVFCAPNLGGESFGITVAEAMSAGCAVVASALPAFKAVLGEHARWTEPGDRHATAQHVTELLRHPDAAADLGTGTRRAAARFGWESVTDRYLDAYGIDSAK